MTADEECEPSFAHYASKDLPVITRAGASLRVVVGSAYGASSPVRASSPMLFVDASLPAGGTVAPPEARAHEELAAYVVEGSVTCDGVTWEAGTLLVFRELERPEVVAREASRVVLVGGAPLDGERYLFWNFVSSSRERLEQAKRDWTEGRFAKVPGDDLEFIPLPE